MSQRGLKGRQLREVSSPKGQYELVRDYMTKLTSAASAGGGASEALAVSGLRASDEIVAVSQRVKGSLGAAMVAWNTQIADGLTVEWSADPGAGAIVEVLVRRLRS